VSTSNSLAAQQKHVAIIGSGISGLSAAWLLSQTMRVTLYEADSRLGGHSNTRLTRFCDRDIPVDTGFIVYNERNYPNLVALFKELGVKTDRSNMSFAVSRANGTMEYSGTGLNGLLGQRRNLLRPRFWSMVRDLLRFYREAPLAIKAEQYANVTIGDYLDDNHYGQHFIDDHLLPMGAAIWSASAAQMRAYPFLAFVRFFVSHGLFNLKNRPQWRTVSGGSRSYVEALSSAMNCDIRLGCKVRSISRREDAVIVTDTNGTSEEYSDVVIACHSDQALSLLDSPTPDEQRLLGAIRYTKNTAVLHCDERLMPKRERVWSSWNYIDGPNNKGDQGICVTYWMNELQSIDKQYPLFVTLNPTKAIDPSKIFETIDYEHPLFDQPALNAQRELWSLQGVQNTWFCGAYFGYGFHEDGLQAGLAVAEQLAGVKRPWCVNEPSSRITVSTENKAAAQ
jgi:predicted NAD/FAD-binding protein